jgi:hypothetical protein
MPKNSKNFKDCLENLSHHKKQLDEALGTKDAEKVLEVCRNVVSDGVKHGYLAIEPSEKEQAHKNPFDISSDDIWTMMPQDIKDSFTYPEDPKQAYEEKIENNISAWIMNVGRRLLDWIKRLEEGLKEELKQVGKAFTKPLKVRDVALPAAILIGIISLNPNGSLRATESLTRDLGNLKEYYNDGLHVHKSLYRSGKEYAQTFNKEVLPQIKKEVLPLIQ